MSRKQDAFKIDEILVYIARIIFVNMRNIAVDLHQNCLISKLKCRFLSNVENLFYANKTNI